MWKITTRGFTLQEVLIMAAMNRNRSDSGRETRAKSVAGQHKKGHICNLETS